MHTAGAATTAGPLRAHTSNRATPALVLFEFFIPLMGRAGSDAAGDIVVAVLVWVALLVVGLSSLSPALHLTSTRSLCRCHNAVVVVIFVAVIYAGSTNPYSKARPKRLFLQHTLRKFEGGVGAGGPRWSE